MAPKVVDPSRPIESTGNVQLDMQSAAIGTEKEDVCFKGMREGNRARRPFLNWIYTTVLTDVCARRLFAELARPKQEQQQQEGEIDPFWPS